MVIAIIYIVTGVVTVAGLAIMDLIAIKKNWECYY